MISVASEKNISTAKKRYIAPFISTITIENMPGGTPWGQAQLRIFDRKFLPALKITKLVFFFL
jgi:hypothetical protein